MRTTRDESGLLFSRGNEALLSTAEAQATWTFVSVGLTDSGTLEHVIDAGNWQIRVPGRRAVRNLILGGKGVLPSSSLLFSSGWLTD
jgi:hypothetical protein